MRGPGCCFGTLLGLGLGAALALGLIVAAVRWAPETLERALRWAVGTDRLARAPLSAPAEDKPLARPDPNRKAAKGTKPRGAGADAKTVAADPATQALRRKVRERVRRIEDDAGRGILLKQPVEFTQAEVQAALTDPRGPLGGEPAGLEADLLPGTLRLRWKARMIQEGKGPAWLARLPALETTLDLAPRVENGRLYCPAVAAQIGRMPVPAPILRALAPVIPSAPRLPPRAGFLLPAGVEWIEVEDERLRFYPEPPWMKETGL